MHPRIRGVGYCLSAGTRRGVRQKNHGNADFVAIFVPQDLVASIKAVSWVVLRSAAVLVAEMSWVRRSVSGGWLSSPVVSRRGGMAVGELRMKAPNDGTTLRTGRKRRK
ncbi:hypothetical protein Tco_1026606 [Tanacetum coccineum]